MYEPNSLRTGRSASRHRSSLLKATGWCGSVALVLLTTSVGPAVADPHNTTTTSTRPAFTNFELGETPTDPVGTTCPGNGFGAACTNHAAEPQIRADNAGNFYATSENGLGGGTAAWKSTTGGLSYATLPSPNQGSSANTTGLSPGGGDTDLATAPDPNPATGQHNVYVASLSLANVDVSTSVDGGKTFTLNPTSATIPGDDREWIAADGPSKVCISYHDVATFNIDVNCSYDAGTTFSQLGDAIDPTHAYLIDNNEIGNLAIDPSSHFIYQIFSGIGNQTQVSCGTAGTCGYNTVWMGVSTDGGITFTDYPVYMNPDPTASYGHQFVNVSVDKAGNVYAVYSDNHNLYYSYSTTQGRTWSHPVQVNSAPSNTAIEPWSVAGDNGKLDVVWYGTSYYSPGTVPDSYPQTAAWQVYFAQNLTATTPGSVFTQTAASPINHYGGVCEGGISCTGNRDLYDDFGVAASPTTGLASIVYSNDQYTDTAASPPQTGCTPAQSNTASCNHTAIATQTSGPGIFTSTTTSNIGREFENSR